ncbi:MAG TPA: hypothetical protein VF442_10535 [Sphingobium sp.]
MLQAKKYTFVIPASGAYRLPVMGDYFVILSLSGDVEVTGDSFGTLGILAAGQGLEATPFSILQFVDKTGAPNTVTVLIAGDKFINQRVFGEVSVIDGGKARSIADRAFAWAHGVGPVAAQFSRTQLWNPAGSGRRVIVKAYSLTSSAASQVNCYANTVALAGLNAIVNSKHPGGAAPSAQCRVETAAAVTVGGVYIDAVVFAAAAFARNVLQEPVVLEPGYGFMQEQLTANLNLNAVYEWTEEVL